MYAQNTLMAQSLTGIHYATKSPLQQIIETKLINLSLRPLSEKFSITYTCGNTELNESLT